MSGVGATSGGMLNVGLAILLVAVGYGVTGVRYPGSGSSPPGVSCESDGERIPDQPDSPPGGNSAHPADTRMRIIMTVIRNGLYTQVTVEGLCEGVFMLLPPAPPVNSMHQAYIPPENNERDLPE